MSAQTDEKSTSPANPADHMALMANLAAALKAVIEADVRKTHGRIENSLRGFDLDAGRVVLWCIVPKGAAMEMARRWPVVKVKG